MGRIVALGTVTLILSTLFWKSVQILIFSGVALWLASLGFPYLADAIGLPAEKPVQAIATLTSSPPTATPLPKPTLAPTVPPPTLEPVDQAWTRTSAELDKVWEKDWQVVIADLRTFLAAYPNHPEARKKLYAALVAYGDVLIGAGRVADGAGFLKEADDMFPAQEAHLKLLALTPVPSATPVPTATPLPPPTSTPIPPTAAPARQPAPAQAAPAQPRPSNQGTQQGDPLRFNTPPPLPPPSGGAYAPIRTPPSGSSNGSYAPIRTP